MPNEHTNWIGWTIANTANVSDIHRLQGQNLIGLEAPAMTATTDALQVQATSDEFYNVAAGSVIWYDVHDKDGNLTKIRVSATVTRHAEIDPIVLQGAKQLRFKAVTIADAAQAQTGAKTGKFCVRPYL